MLFYGHGEAAVTYVVPVVQCIAHQLIIPAWYGCHRDMISYEEEKQLNLQIFY